jgi:hypothetical protein
VENYITDLLDAHHSITEAAVENQKKVIDAYLKKSPEHPTVFEVGDLVLVSYPDRPPNKLSSKWRGPVSIVDISGNTYSLQDLRTLAIFRADISRLKLFHQDARFDNLDLAARDEDELVVEKIVDHTGSPRMKSQMQFRVRWAGFEPDEDTWEPYSHVRELSALDAYVALHPELKSLERNVGIIA